MNNVIMLNYLVPSLNYNSFESNPIGATNRNMLHIVEILIFTLCYIIPKIPSVRGREYIIGTEKCRIPHYEPFNDETVGLWSPESFEACSSKPLLSRIEKTNDKATVHIENHLLPIYGKNISCCVANILRKVDVLFPDDRIGFTRCEQFEQQVELNSSAVTITCRDGSGNKVYQNAHYVISKSEEVRAKFERNPPLEKPISVIFIVIDSVSRLNFIRTLPKSRNYVLENGFLEMKGYNKIDDNTFPNFLSLLTGLNKRQVEEIHCTGRRKNELDTCPMIWYDFSSAGYVTAYGEDWGYLNTFNYNRKGFTKPPTDFYFRPYVLASEGIGTFSVKGAPFCAGPVSSGERQLDLALDFGKTFKNLPYFGIFWMNTFSHQALNTPSRFDDKIREFATNLKAEGILDDSVVVFLSDHGMRMDQTIRRTLAGWFEERLPTNFISVPKWFREKYPSKYDNLRINSNKLTSTHDMYMTLQNILKLSYPTHEVRPSRACPSCVSLFDEIPTRTCSEAGIPKEWCTCIGHLNPMNTSDTLVLKAAEFALDHIKSELNKLNMTDVCYTYELLNVKTAGLSETSEREGEKYLFINFLTNPYAEFIATLKYQNISNLRGKEFRLLQNIIRLDWVNNNCLNYSKMVQYCNCKPANNLSTY